MLELLKFSVKGFKGFKDEIVLDMTDKREENPKSKNLAIIIGKEGAGRTNLGEALFDISYNFNKNVVRPKNMYTYDDSSIIVEFRYEFHDPVLNTIYVYKYKVYDGETYDVKVDETINNHSISEDKKDKVIGEISDFALSMLFIKNCKERFPRTAGDLDDEIFLSYEFFSDFEEFLSSCIGLKINFAKIYSELYFEKDDVFLPFFGCANKRLIDLYILFSNVWYGHSLEDKKYSLIYVDDLPFINDVSYVSFPYILKFLRDRSRQLIVAPIDTRYFRPERDEDDLYVIADGQVKEIQEWTNKDLRFGHNFEVLYRGGAFDV